MHIKFFNEYYHRMLGKLLTINGFDLDINYTSEKISQQIWFYPLKKFVVLKLLLAGSNPLSDWKTLTTSQGHQDGTQDAIRMLGNFWLSFNFWFLWVWIFSILKGSVIQPSWSCFDSWHRNHIVVLYEEKVISMHGIRAEIIGS